MKKRTIRKRKKAASPSPRSDSDRSSSTLAKVFPVVGIGASAGGLEAFSALLAEGAVISFQDIHALKHLVEETRAQIARL